MTPFSEAVATTVLAESRRQRLPLIRLASESGIPFRRLERVVTHRGRPLLITELYALAQALDIPMTDLLPDAES